jgi:hypothetical protein
MFLSQLGHDIIVTLCMGTWESNIELADIKQYDFEVDFFDYLNHSHGGAMLF